MYSIPFVGLLVISCLFCIANGAPAPANELVLGAPRIPIRSTYRGPPSFAASYSGPTMQMPDPALYNTNSRQYPNSQQSAHYSDYNHPLNRGNEKLGDIAHLGKWAGQEIGSRMGETFDTAKNFLPF